MFEKVLDLSQSLMSNLSDFASSILDFLSREFPIGNTSYTVFTLLFTGAILIIISWGIAKFVTDIVA